METLTIHEVEDVELDSIAYEGYMKFLKKYK